MQYCHLASTEDTEEPQHYHRHKPVLRELWGPQDTTMTQKWPGCQKAACFPTKHQEKYTRRSNIWESTHPYGCCASSRWILEPRSSFKAQLTRSKTQSGKNHHAPQTSILSGILADMMKTFPTNGCLQDLYPSLPSLQYCQGQTWARTARIESPSDGRKCPSAGCSFAFCPVLL